MSPEVCVVIPTRNRCDILARTLRTVLWQQDVDLQVVVVDEGSSDATPAMLRAVRDPRLLVLRHDQPQGVAKARNAGIARCTAPWVAFLDDDDLWAPRKLRAQLDALRQDGEAAWSCTGSVRVYGEQLRVGAAEPVPGRRDIADVLLHNNVIPGGASSVLASTELVRAVGGFDPRLSNLADWDLWTRLGLRSPLVSVPHALVGYYTHVGSMAGDVGSALRDLDVVEDKYAAERAERGVRLSVENMLWYLAGLQLRAGRPWTAARLHLRLVPYGRPAVHALRHAVLGLVWPGLQAFRDRREERNSSQAWRAEADTWLEPLRGPE